MVLNDCQVDLTISQSLSILRMCVMVLNDDPVKLTWPFPNLFLSAACMWQFSMILSSCPDHFPIFVYPQLVCDVSMILSSWPDHFPISVHPQQVCDGSQCSCDVDGHWPTLSTLSEYVIALNDPVKLTWPSILSLYVMLLNDSVKLTWQFFNLCPSLGCMWWFSMILSSWPDHFPISVYPQQVCDSSQWSCQVDLTIYPQFVCDASQWSC